MVDDWGFGADEKTGWVWLDDTRENAAWYEALVAIDARDDKQPLIKLLQSGQKVPPSIAFYIGDLLARYQLKLPRSRPRRPAYQRTQEQINLIAAEIEVHRLVHQDEVPLAEALEKVAAESKLPIETVQSAYLGKHGGLQRAKRHWYRP
jgi:hypothetical protein